MMDPGLVVKVTVVLGGALVALKVARAQPASVRALLLTAAFVVAVALPAASTLGPVVPVMVPSAFSAQVAPIPLPSGAPDGSLDVLIPPPADVTTRPPVPSISLSAWLEAIWLAGVVVLIAPLLVSLWRAVGVRRRARPWERPVAAAAALPGVDLARLDVRVSEELHVPMAFGVTTPVVLLPKAAGQWTPAELSHALTHELEHIRRKDLIVIAIARVGCALYWFHPLVWMAWRRLRLEMERACDDAVVVGGERVAYAEQLVDLARRVSGARAMMAMAGSSDLSARVTAVLDPTLVRGRVRPGTVRLTVLAACLATLLVSPLRIVAAQGGAQPELQWRSTPVKGGGNVVGVVYDPTGAPLGGLLLILEMNCFGPGNRECGFGSWTRTDRDGHFRFEGLPRGNFHITSQIDFFPGAQFNVTMGETTERDITMAVMPVEAEFTVCAECPTIVVPDSLAKEFEADRADALDHPVSAPRPAMGWEFYKPGKGDYPPALKQAGLEGSVVVEGRIGLDGAPVAMKAEPAGTALATAAVAALAEEQWEPGRVRGVAIEVPFRFLIRYTLKE